MKKFPKKISRIEQRQAKAKAAFLEILEEVPIIRVASAKIGVGRATVYRWLTEDPSFRESVEKRQGLGIQMVNDMAESVLISQIQNKNEKTARYWLEKHHPTYRQKYKPPPRIFPKESDDESPTPYIIIDR